MICICHDTHYNPESSFEHEHAPAIIEVKIINKDYAEIIDSKINRGLEYGLHCLVLRDNLKELKNTPLVDIREDGVYLKKGLDTLYFKATQAAAASRLMLEIIGDELSKGSSKTIEEFSQAVSNAFK